MLTRAALLLVFVASVYSLNFISNALGSNMVLQRAPEHANVWGWSKQAASTIQVTFNNKVYRTMADAAGAWSVLLDPTMAGGPYAISVTSSAGESGVLQNVLFGDIFVCGGQSNMQFTVDSAYNATAEVAAADGYPNIRVFTVGQGTTSATPLLEFATIAQQWSVASSRSIGAGNWSEFSAACWFFGRDLYNQYKVPIGLFSDNWGGTIVQAWSSPDALTKCHANPVEARKVNIGGPNDPSQLWNAMIVPALPMSIKGAIWYQGESNAGQPNYYACGFPAMIADWRMKWGGGTNKEFGFYFVQLAPWINGDNVAEPLTRLAQLYATALPNVGFGTAADLGDPTSPFGNIHPRGKQMVGHRLSLAARAITYKENIQYTGPLATSWKVASIVKIGEDRAVANVDVNFDVPSVGTGLKVQPFSCDPNVPPAQCIEYEIGTSAGWVPAKAVITGKASISVSAEIGSATVGGVRYANSNYPIMTLWNMDGLPATPFYFPNPITPNFQAKDVIIGDL